MRGYIALTGTLFQTLFLVEVGECEKLVEVYDGEFGAGRMFCFGRCLKGVGTCVRELTMLLPSVLWLRHF